MATSDKHLNIIAFDVPYPPNYGGVIDIFYKIKSLHEAGVKIHLHCFEYGREHSTELKKYCSSVNYYSRKTAKSLLFNTLPYIVLSRESDLLKKHLLANHYPILMEGLHSTFLLNDQAFSKRKIIVRTHNIEHDYYENLAKVESNVFKRYYFYNEAGKLKKYEVILNKASGVAAISPADSKYLSKHYKNVHYIPAFHPYERILIREGSGNYAFYHGNLSVGENNEAALFLINKVFNDIPYDLIIAGSKPSDELRRSVRGHSNIELIDDLTPSDINDYIMDAQCNILPTFQATGIKLKLLAALFAGRHCIVNKPMVDHTGLESLCIVANDAQSMKQKIKSAFEKSFTTSDIHQREKLLSGKFDNTANVKKLLKLLF